MKAKIKSITYYIAETENGKKYSVDIKNPLIKNALDTDIDIEGDIHREERQDRYSNGEYSRSYTIIEKFIPKRERITLTEEYHNHVDKYEMKFGKEFTKTMEEIREEIKIEEKSKPKHITLPKNKEK